MLIRAGYEISLQGEQEPPLMALLSIHPSRADELRTPAVITSTHRAPLIAQQDEFGNVRTCTVAPPGVMKLSTNFVVQDSGQPDEVAPWAAEVPVADLPAEPMSFLLGSRYCETDRLSELAWSLFGNAPRGWARLQTIVDYQLGFAIVRMRGESVESPEQSGHAVAVARRARSCSVRSSALCAWGMSSAG